MSVKDMEGLESNQVSVYKGSLTSSFPLLHELQWDTWVSWHKNILLPIKSLQTDHLCREDVPTETGCSRNGPDSTDSVATSLPCACNSQEALACHPEEMFSSSFSHTSNKGGGEVKQNLNLLQHRPLPREVYVYKKLFAFPFDLKKKTETKQ